MNYSSLTDLSPSKLLCFSHGTLKALKGLYPKGDVVKQNYGFPKEEFNKNKANVRIQSL
jgi:hypothetical protein